MVVWVLLASPLVGSAGAERPLSVRDRGAKPALDVRPEYERRLSRVLLSFPALEEKEFAAQRDLMMRAAYGEVFRSLPPYASFVVASAKADEQAARVALSSLAGREVRHHSLASASPDLWAQDMGEPVLDGTERKFLVSRLNANHQEHYGVTKDRRETAIAIFGEDAILEASFVFEGGNLAFDRTEDGLRVFMGYDDVLSSVLLDEAKGRPSRIEHVLQRVSRLFSGAEVVLLGSGPQSPYLFHLDQAFVLLEGGVAVMASLEGEPSSRERAELALYRRQLESLGYAVHAIPHSTEDIHRYRNSVNAVPFVDGDGNRRILYPVFSGEVTGDPPGALTQGDLTGKGLLAYDVYERAGYGPIPVRDFTGVSRGNLHCVVNALD